MKRKQNIRWNTMKILVIGFLSVIVLGAVLLWLPVSNEKPISFLDALFTSTTSVCVTGLVTVVPKYQFTIMGKIILLILIQIGGLGIIACITAFFMLLKRKITVKERIVIQEAYNMNSLGGLVGMVRRILFGTVVVEGIGAVFYAIQFSRDYGLVKGIWYGVFHSVSAFCNAGFDILGTTKNTFPSLLQYAGNALVNVVIMLLIIIGGIGFLTWEDVCTNTYHFRRYRLQSKIVLVTTAVLILLPSLFFFFWNFKNLAMEERLLASFFQAVTPRTAGFNTVDIGKMAEPAQTLIIILMLIGGSPSSTAGGMKTTTIAVLLLNAFATFRSKDTVSAFHRRIDNHVIRDAATLLMLYVMLFFGGGIAISMYEGLPLAECLYETASAVGTVGLTLGITPHLHMASQLILIVLMYLGRVGGLTLIYAVFSSRNKSKAKFPVEQITVG